MRPNGENLLLSVMVMIPPLECPRQGTVESPRPLLILESPRQGTVESPRPFARVYPNMDAVGRLMVPA
jgi:hypothetical protein